MFEEISEPQRHKLRRAVPVFEPRADGDLLEPAVLPGAEERLGKIIGLGGGLKLRRTIKNRCVAPDEQPAEVFLRVKGPDCSSELIGLYDVVARLMSLALRYGAPLEKVGNFLAGSRFEPCSAVVGHDRIKYSSSLPT